MKKQTRKNNNKKNKSQRGGNIDIPFSNLIVGNSLLFKNGKCNLKLEETGIEQDFKIDDIKIDPTNKRCNLTLSCTCDIDKLHHIFKDTDQRVKIKSDFDNHSYTSYSQSYTKNGITYHTGDILLSSKTHNYYIISKFSMESMGTIFYGFFPINKDEYESNRKIIVKYYDGSSGKSRETFLQDTMLGVRHTRVDTYENMSQQITPDEIYGNVLTKGEQYLGYFNTSPQKVH